MYGNLPTSALLKPACPLDGAEKEPAALEPLLDAPICVVGPAALRGRDPRDGDRVLSAGSEWRKTCCYSDVDVLLDGGQTVQIAQYARVHRPCPFSQIHVEFLNVLEF